MEFDERLPVELIEALVALDRNCRSLPTKEGALPSSPGADKDAEARKPESREGDLGEMPKSVLAEYRHQISGLLSANMDHLGGAFSRLQRCKEQLALIDTAEQSITDPERCASLAEKARPELDVTLESLLQGEVDLIAMAYRANRALASRWARGRREVCGLFVETNRQAREILNAEVLRLRTGIERQAREMRTRCGAAGTRLEGELLSAWTSAQGAMVSAARRTARLERNSAGAEKGNARADAAAQKQMVETWKNDFLKRFSPEKLLAAHKAVYAREPMYAHYTCPTAQPYRLHVADVEYDLAPLELSAGTMAFLERYYYFLLRGTRLSIPYCVTLRADFNWMLRFPEDARDAAAKDACGLALRLFLLLPPRKALLTFFDPAALGESFALFHQLVSVSGRNLEIIDGGIWSDPMDIEERLRQITVHIAGVTQRCLQGKYRTLADYNQTAGVNAEAWRFLFLMDFPAGLNTRSLTYLEQITEFGPKCGVFPLLFCGEEQLQQLDEALAPRVEALMAGYCQFQRSGVEAVEYPNMAAAGRRAELRFPALPEGQEMDVVLEELRRGLEDAKSMPAGGERFLESPAEATADAAAAGFRVPIGLREGNVTQYLSLLPEPGQHLLIAAQNKGESTALLHTILMNALDRYRSPEDLEIFLAEFRQKTEYEIYTKYSIPCFRVISLKSEVEFGRSILRSILHELRIRVDLFRKCGAESFAEYRTLPLRVTGIPLPRLLVVLDEFQELFTAGEELAADCRRCLERIIRYGAQCGIYLILSSRNFNFAATTGMLSSTLQEAWVRIVLKCSDAEGRLLLNHGNRETELIPNGMPGRGIYNSGAGAEESSVYFQALAYNATVQREKLGALHRPGEARIRILAADPADNPYSIYQCFSKYPPARCPEPGRLYLGEAMMLEDNLPVCLSRTAGSNLLLVGSDSEEARGICTYALLSLLVNRRVAAGSKRKRTAPWIFLLNYKPLRDRYFVDGPDLLAQRLNRDLRNVPVQDRTKVEELLRELWERIAENRNAEEDCYLLLFGYQRAMDFHGEAGGEKNQELQELLEKIVTQGPENGVHTMLWQDSFQGFSRNGASLLPQFRQRIAFQLTPEEYSNCVGIDDSSAISENCAVYDNALDDVRLFRPYAAPSRSWLEALCRKL